MQTRARITLATLGLVVLAAALLQVKGPALLVHAQKAAQVWFCPMHPEVVERTPGTCPRCSMQLVPGDPREALEYRLEFTTEPAAIRAGTPVDLRFRVIHPKSGEIVRNFEVVHAKRYHLFVVSQDFDFFDHVHPDQQSDGSWSLRVTLPRPGYYRLYSDLLGRGGVLQVAVRTISTAGFDGDLPSSQARLVSDKDFVKTVGRTTVILRR